MQTWGWLGSRFRWQIYQVSFLTLAGQPTLIALNLLGIIIKIE